jgi:vacuolar-type H+-ATPase subunit H
MRDVIQKIIATENEAKLLVEKANAEADRILSDAQKKGQSMVDRAREEALFEAERIMEAAIEGAEREKQDRLAQIAAEIERDIQLDQERRESVVEGVVRCVCGLP